MKVILHLNESKKENWVTEVDLLISVIQAGIDYTKGRELTERFDYDTKKRSIRVAKDVIKAIEAKL